jgi:hypothetical protein
VKAGDLMQRIFSVVILLWLFVLTQGLKTTQRGTLATAGALGTEFEAITNLQVNFGALQDAHIVLQRQVLDLSDVVGKVQARQRDSYYSPGISWQTNPPIWQHTPIGQHTPIWQTNAPGYGPGTTNSGIATNGP